MERKPIFGTACVWICLFFGLGQGRDLQALVPNSELQQIYNLTQLEQTLVSPGIRGYLEHNEDYSVFLSMIQSVPAYSTLLNGPWAKSASNNTVLIPTNEALEAAFVTVGQDLGIDANLSDYLGLVNSTLGLSAIQMPLQTILAALLDSHILTQPINLYADSQVTGASENLPITLPATNLSALDSPVAYADSSETVYVLQPTGLLSTPLPIPEFYGEQTGSQTSTSGVSLYLYEVTGVLIAANVQNGTQSMGTAAAFTALQPYL